MKTKTKHITLGIALLFCCFFLLSSCAGALNKFQDNVRRGNYAEALDIYENDIQGNSSSENECYTFLEEFLETSWNSYLENELTGDDLNNILSTLKMINTEIPVPGVYQVEQDYLAVKESRSNFDQGITCLEEGDYLGAITAFEGVVELDAGNYERAQEQLGVATTSYEDEILKIANDNIANRDYDTAISVVIEATQLIGNTATLEDFLRKTYTLKYENLIEKTFQNEDYEAVISAYEEAIENPYTTISAEMTSDYTISKTKYREEIISQSINTYKENGYSTAAQVVQKGLAILPDDEQLAEYYELYLSCAPVSLSDLVEIDRSNDNFFTYFNTVQDISDYFGTTLRYNCRFQRAYYYYDPDREPWVEYFLDGKYSSFSCSFLTDDIGPVFQLTISGDGVTLYDSGTLDWESGCTQLSIDIAGVDKLKISVNFRDSSDFDGVGVVYLGNDLLTKELSDEDFL